MNAPEPALFEQLQQQGGALALPQGLLEQMVLRTAHPVITTDAQRRITWVNPAFEQLTGYRLAEVVGRAPAALLQCEHTDAATVQRLRAALDAGQPARETLLNRSRDGRVYWTDLDIQPYRPADAAPDSAPLGFVAFQSDLSVRGLASDSLRAAIDGAAAGLVVQDERGRIIDCNPAAERLLGLTRAQMMGLNSIDPRWSAIDDQGHLLPGDQHPAMRTLHTGLAEREVVMGIDLPDGQRRWLTVNTNLMPAERGLRRVVASFTDITASRELERTLETRWAQLRQILDGTQTALWEWNVPTGELRLDERWAVLMGYRPDERTPASIEAWAALVHPDDLVEARAQLAEHFCGARPFHDFECRMRHCDGRWRWMRLRGRAATASADGRAQWMYGTQDDITQRKEAELAALSAHARLQGLFDLSPVGILRQDDRTLAVLECNAAMTDITGLSRDELLASTGQSLMASGSTAIGPPQRAQLSETGRCDPCEAEMRHASGRPVAVQVSAMRVTDPDGTPYLWTMVQDLSRSKALEHRLTAAARTDRLTGLKNRTLMMEKLEEAVRQAGSDGDGRLALLFLDFDRFKLVNDAFGHSVGDALLIAIARRLRRVMAGHPAGHQPLAARFGGDEFVVLMPEKGHREGAWALAQALLANLAAPYLIGGREIHSSASIGIAIGGAGDTAEGLLRNADTAMYEAKRLGRGHAVFFDESMHARLSRSVQIEAALRQAIPRGELGLLYQPIVDLASGTMSSVEALVRWQNAALGAVSPAEFIPIAEESGQIVAIGEWVLRGACTQWAQWQASDPARAPQGISVNLSRVQMQLGEQMLAVVQQVLADTGMPATALQLEITEREVMKDPQGAQDLMRGLRRLGVKLAMDDFGTGTSSLGCLRDYPFDTIKIDKSFVSNLSHDLHVLAVAHATVNVIENLGMVSVAEGIEEPAEAAVLLSMGCRYGQGWLFAKALTADQVLGWTMAPLPPA